MASLALVGDASGGCGTWSTLSRSESSSRSFSMATEGEVDARVNLSEGRDLLNLPRLET